MNIRILKDNSKNEINRVIELIRLNSDLNWSDKQIADCFNNDQNIVIGYIFKEKIIGIIFLSYICDSADILYICVDKEFRKQNIARELIFESFKILSSYKVENIILEVSINNVAAIFLYTKIGFKKISIRKNYYIHNNKSIDALIYQYFI